MKEEQNNIQIPLGWVCKTLEELSTDLHQGINTAADKITYTDRGYKILQAKHVTTGEIDWSDARYISTDDYHFYKGKYNPRENDILLTNIGTIGKSLVVNREMEFLIAWNIFLIRLKNELSSTYINYYLKYLDGKKYFQSVATGVATLFVNKANLSKINIPTPVIDVQLAIVSKIEELFSKLDKGIEQLKAAQQQLKTYRQAILKYAFENIYNREIVSVENCCTNIVDCLHSTAKFSSSGYFCVDTTCIENGKILFNKIRYVDEKTYLERISRLKPEGGDILFAREGTVGTTLVVPQNVDLCLGQRMMMFRLKKEILPKYFMYYFQSSLFKAQYRPLIMGTTAPHLNIRDIRKFNVVITSFEGQNSIVQEIESRLSVADKMEESINQSLQQAEALRQSILKKAFEGKLVS